MLVQQHTKLFCVITTSTVTVVEYEEFQVSVQLNPVSAEGAQYNAAFYLQSFSEGSVWIGDKEGPSSHHCIVGENISKPMSPNKGSVYLENYDLVKK